MYSMTGYGMGESSNDRFHTKIEIKSVNNRYCDIAIRLPRNLISLEEKIKREIKSKVSRGKIDVFINIESIENTSSTIDVDIPLAKQYYEALLKLNKGLGLNDEVRLFDIYKMPNVITSTVEENDIEDYWKVIKEALDISIESFLDMRKIEGENIKLDIHSKLSNIVSSAEIIKNRAPISLEENTKKFKENISNNLKDENLDIQRLTTEVAIICDKLSIDEEITRLKIHTHNFNDIISQEGPIGRKLDFLIQEMNRESNTIGSKSNDIEITSAVVMLKSEIEKLREQAQNVE